MRALDGRTVAILESRKAEDLAAMVARLGGTPVLAPAVRERPTGYDAGPLLTQIAQGRFPVAVVLTGAALTALLTEAERRGVLDPVRAAFATMTLACRGPKPLAALKRYGLSASLSTTRPHTSRELLEVLSTISLEAAAVVLLHYGERNPAISDALRTRGAQVEDVCMYEWALPEDVTPLEDLVRRICTANPAIDALLVTSQVQLRFLLEIARRTNLATALTEALNAHVVVGAVGPVCADALRAAGVIPDVMPAAPNSASLVGALADYFELTDPSRTD